MKQPVREQHNFATPELPQTMAHRLTHLVDPWVHGAGFVCQFGPVQADESQSFTIIEDLFMPSRANIRVEGRVRPGPEGSRVEVALIPNSGIMMSVVVGAMFGMSGVLTLLAPGPNRLFGLLFILGGSANVGLNLWLYQRARARVGRVLGHLFPREDWR